VGMYGMFKKAGIEPWKAFIPFYNTWLIVEKCHIRKYWFWLQFIPIAGQFITIWITIIFVMHFKKVTLSDHTHCFPSLYLFSLSRLFEKSKMAWWRDIKALS
jgi:signal peptidase I